MPVYLLHDLWYPHLVQVQVHLLAILCSKISRGDLVTWYKTARTEFESQTCRLLAGPWQHLGLDLHSIGARIRRDKREEQSGGLGAQREGVECDADVGEEPSDHAEEVVVGTTYRQAGRRDNAGAMDGG